MLNKLLFSPLFILESMMGLLQFKTMFGNLVQADFFLEIRSYIIVQRFFF